MERRGGHYRGPVWSPVDAISERLPGRLRPAWELVVRTVRDSLEDRIPGLAAEAAFFALLSLPPLLLVIVGGFATIAEDATGELEQVILGFAGRFLSSQTMGDFVVPFVNDLVATGGRGVLSVGIITGLWAASRATAVYLDAIRIAYDAGERRSAWKRRLLALGLTIGGIAVSLVLLPALLLGDELVRLVDFLLPSVVERTTIQVVDALFWPTVAVVALSLLTTSYHVGIPGHTPWRRDVPGALLALALWLAGSAGLRLYVGATFRDDPIYGVLAAPLVVLLWLYVTAFAVLLGAELNAEIEKMWPATPGLAEREQEEQEKETSRA